MDMRETKITGELMFDGKIFKVERDIVLCPNGNESFREIVRHIGGAGVLCVTPNEEVLLVKQFRYAYDEVMYEIPAGKLNEGEDPYVSAMREFEEETGNKADKLDYLGCIYPTVGYCSEKIYIYLATNYVPTQTNYDEDELIEIHYIPLKEVVKMISNGEIKDAKTIAAIMYYISR